MVPLIAELRADFFFDNLFSFFNYKGSYSKN